MTSNKAMICAVVAGLTTMIASPAQAACIHSVWKFASGDFMMPPTIEGRQCGADLSVKIHWSLAGDQGWQPMRLTAPGKLETTASFGGNTTSVVMRPVGNTMKVGMETKSGGGQSYHYANYTLQSMN